MSPPMHLTSVPSWVREPVTEPVDPSGSDYLLLSIGEVVAAEIAQTWAARLAAEGKRVVSRHVSSEDAVRVFEGEFAVARVGWRVMVAGTASDCLRLRSAMVSAGLADDEFRFASVDTTYRDVWCAHCQVVTTTQQKIGETVYCQGCEKSLLIYYHVSRRMAAHMGFQVDAEALVD